MVRGRADATETIATIIHADLDAFHASVEQLLDPSLRGRPIAVGGGVKWEAPAWLPYPSGLRLDSAPASCHSRTMTIPASLETDRLRLRPRVLADLNANVAMDLDTEVHRFLFAAPPDPSKHRDEVRSRIISGWPEIGGLWVVEYHDASEFLGWCGLFPLEQSGMIEIGYRFVRNAWGHAIATEAAGIVLDHGFRVLDIDPIVAVVHPDNIRSQRVIERIGLSPQGSARHYGRDLLFYRLGRSEYLARRTAPSL